MSIPCLHNLAPWHRRLLWLLMAVCAVWLARTVFAPGVDHPTDSVFELPRLHAQSIQLQHTIAQLFAQGQYAEAESRCHEAIGLFPDDAFSHYNLACALSRQGKTAEAIASLGNAIALGFNHVQLMQSDPDLETVRSHAEFDKLLEAARVAVPQPWQQTVMPGVVRAGQVRVSAANTAYNPYSGTFLTFFTFPASQGVPRHASERDMVRETWHDDTSERLSEAKLTAARPRPIIVAHGRVGDLLRTWFEEGTAAGNYGDFYDNHDNDHSNLRYEQFPQLTRIEFDRTAKQRNLHRGLQTRFLYNGITFGNASMSNVDGPYWRSLPRLAYTDVHAMAILYVQYVSNHLYVYPEHQDHDRGHNGAGGGYGDVYSANTPYVIIAQGSSGSDASFLDAIACTLAAFRPEVKQWLAQNRALIPTVQMIFRLSNKPLIEPSDYLTGKAHPTVFDGRHIDTLRMIEMAHKMRQDEVPPVVQLRVVRENAPARGKDYFDVAADEKLFDTPAAIARVARSTQYAHHMVVSAKASYDLNHRPLTWHWRVLRGDVERIKITPLNDDGSVVELQVPYHQRRLVEGSDVASNRVDIGVFVHNGQYYSAPGFMTFFFLDNQVRVYNDKHLIDSVQYTDHAQGGNYVDPRIDVAKTWRDEYHYDDQSRLIGWTRMRDQEKQSFTADGALITKRDDQGRVLEARTVTYVERPRENQPPALEQQLGHELLYYTYSTPGDRIGHVQKRLEALYRDDEF
jgi:hypothetical protein